MAPIDNPVLPLGSTILVTGANGFVAATLADLLLSQGYNVRGSVRDTTKNAWMTSHFEQKYGGGRFELAHVPDITVEGAFDTAMKDVTGVAHVAAILNQETDASKVVPPSLASMKSILESAAKTPSVKRFVLTSTGMTVRALDRHDPVVLTQDSWNYDSLVNAWMPPPLEPGRGLEVYAAAKVASEKAMWKFAEQRKPGFVCNSVLPALVFGRLLSPEHQGTPSSTHFVTALFKSNMDVIGPSTQLIKTFNYSDNDDVAHLHLAGLVHPDVQGERLWAYDKPCTWNDLLAIFRKNFPDHHFIDDVQGIYHDPAKNQPAERADRLLRELGRPGLADMEQSLVKWIPQFM